MVTNPRSPASTRTNLTLVRKARKNKNEDENTQNHPGHGHQHSACTGGFSGSTAVSASGHKKCTGSGWAPLGQTLFIDGVATNTGVANVSGATVEVDFHDAQGKVVSRVQKPMGGIAHGTGFIKNEFSYNPIRPNEMRFFRVAIEQAPSGWNLEVPQLKVITVKEQ